MVGLEQEAFAEYFGFEVQKSAKNGSTTNQIKSKNGGGSKSSKKKSGGETSKSKGKKIVFSKKIVNLYHWFYFTNRILKVESTLYSIELRVFESVFSFILIENYQRSRATRKKDHMKEVWYLD